MQLGQSTDTGTLFAYDYTRDAQNDYPRAHFHIYADMGEHYQKALANSGRDKLRDLHFPLGGFSELDGSVRFRPILENIIEMLVLENMVTPRPSWKNAVIDGVGKTSTTGNFRQCSREIEASVSYYSRKS